MFFKGPSPLFNPESLIQLPGQIPVCFSHKKHHSSLLPVHGTRSISDKASAQDRHGSTMTCVCQVSIILLVGKHQKTHRKPQSMISCSPGKQHQKLQIGIPISFVSRCLQDITPTLKLNEESGLGLDLKTLQIASTWDLEDTNRIQQAWNPNMKSMDSTKSMVFLCCESCVSPGFDLQIYASSTICMSMHEQ